MQSIKDNDQFWTQIYYLNNNNNFIIFDKYIKGIPNYEVFVVFVCLYYWFQGKIIHAYKRTIKLT